LLLLLLFLVLLLLFFGDVVDKPCVLFIASLKGSFEVNPPFAASVIAQALSHMSQLLAAATGALQFIVFVPEWAQEPCWKALSSSPYKTREVRIAVREHVYVHSSLTAPKDARLVHGVLHTSTNDTTVFFLQNDAGRAKWTISNNAVRRLRAAFGKEKQPPKQQTSQEKSKKITAAGKPGSNWRALKKEMDK
jgi:hypothetical protein